MEDVRPLPYGRGSDLALRRRPAFMPLGGLFVGVAGLEHGGLVPETADDLEAGGKALVGEAAADRQRRVAGGIEAAQQARPGRAAVLFLSTNGNFGFPDWKRRQPGRRTPASGKRSEPAGR